MSDNGKLDIARLAREALERATWPTDKRRQPRVMLWHYDNDGQLVERRPVDQPASVPFDPDTDRHELTYANSVLLVTAMNIDDL